MKLKFNWGTGIVIAMSLYIVFILQFVYRTMAVEEYEHHLVSDNYYEDELYYQQEIDKVKHGNELAENVSIEQNNEGVFISFPSNMDYSKISGGILFKRLSNEKLDLVQAINLSSNQILITDAQLVKGRYNLVIDWKYGNEEYMFKDNIFY